MAAAITEEEIAKFVQDWFQKLDNHAPVDECYRMLASYGLEMHFPECTIWDFDTFRQWYERVIGLFFDEKHIVKIAPPTIDGDRADVDLEVAWQATWVEPPRARTKHVALTTKQKWTLQRSAKNGYGLEIAFYDAAVEPFKYEPESSRLPPEEAASGEPQDKFLETGYQELCASYHAIDTFRGTLLGALPFATGTGVFLLLNKNLAGLTGFLRPIGLFGIAITLGLFAYELYGIMKCDALIASGQQFECQLGIRGQFASRPRSLLNLINEPFAAALIYPAVLAAWVYVAFCYGPVTPNGPHFSGDARWFALVSFLASATVTLAYNFWLARRAKRIAHHSTMLRTLAEANESMLAAEETGDQAVLENYLADEFTIVRATGTKEDRRSYLNAVPENKNRGRAASGTEIRLQDKRAVFTCYVMTSRTPDGRPANGRFWNTRLFEWRDGHWKCTNWQVMKLPGD